METNEADSGSIGREAATEAIAQIASRPNPGGYLSAQAENQTESGGLPYKILRQAHPSYDAEYWRELRALYEGGKALLRDDELMARLFPKHRGEHETLYKERKLRAFYIPYAAEILDHLIAGLTSDPIVMELGTATKDSKDAAGLPPFYQDFVEDVSPEGGARVTLNEILADQLRVSLQLRCAWTLVDLPSSDPKAYASPVEQEAQGALDAFAVALDPESVIDWEEDEAGELEWALIRVVESRRPTLKDSRTTVTERWTYYSATEWERYELVRQKDREPKDEDIVPLVASGVHSFGRVPLVRLVLPPGLWAMNKMAGIAIEHFNKRAALAWGELQSLLPELYEFLAPPMTRMAVINEKQDDGERAVNQRRGQGFVQQRGNEDRAEFVGPEVGAFTEARNSCDGLRDDLHRVMHQMALAAANTPSALKRSAESKQQDTAAVEIVLGELGRLVRKHAMDLFNMVSCGRQETDEVNEWVAKGMSEFDAVAVADAIEEALSIDMLHIESPTFRKRHREQLVRAILADKATPEDLETIDRELETNITDESIMPPEPPPPPGPGDGARPGSSLRAGGAGGAAPGGGARPPATPKKPPRGRPAGGKAA